MSDRRALNRILGRAGRYFVALSLCLLALETWAVKETQPDFPGDNTQLPPSKSITYTNATDEELKSLGARWDLLSAPERRALLAEVRMRWARDRNGATRVRIQATRQFGVVRKPDGTTIRVERRIIRIIPAERGYGTGFEQRVRIEPGAIRQQPENGFFPENRSANTPGLRVRASSEILVPGAAKPTPESAPDPRSNH